MMMLSIALTLTLTSTASAAETCSSDWLDDVCGGDVPLASDYSANNKLASIVNSCLQIDDACCVVVNADLSDNSITNSEAGLPYLREGTDQLDLVLLLEDGGALPQELNLAGRQDICRGTGGSGTCYIRSLTLCHPSERGEAPNVSGVDYTVDGLDSQPGELGLRIHGLRFFDSEIVATETPVTVTDSLFVRSDSSPSLRIDESFEAARFARTAFCNAEGPGLDFGPNTDTFSSRELVLVNSVFSTGSGVALGADDADIVAWNNNWLSDDAGLALTSASTLTGGNNLFLGGGADLGDGSITGAWSHNAHFLPTGNALVGGDTAITSHEPVFSDDVTGPFSCNSGALGELLDGWPYHATNPSTAPRGLVPARYSDLLVAGTPPSPSWEPDGAGQPADCPPDIGALGGPWAPDAFWAENVDGDCIDDDRDCDNGDDGGWIDVFEDFDGDDHAAPTMACATQDERELSNALRDADLESDCDDEDSDRSPSLPELCDGIDNDCDDLIDEDFDNTVTWYAVIGQTACVDHDDTLQACEQPADVGEKSWTNDPNAYPSCGVVAYEDSDIRPYQLLETPGCTGKRGYALLLFLSLLGLGRRRRGLR